VGLWLAQPGDRAALDRRHHIDARDRLRQSLVGPVPDIIFALGPEEVREEGIETGIATSLQPEFAKESRFHLKFCMNPREARNVQPLPKLRETICAPDAEESSCGRRWRLEHWLGKDGELFGPSWILQVNLRENPKVRAALFKPRSAVSHTRRGRAGGSTQI
jgi:hypothetical protein